MGVSTKTTEDATRRLAVCNLDWDRVTATDLFGRVYFLSKGTVVLHWWESVTG